MLSLLLSLAVSLLVLILPPLINPVLDFKRPMELSLAALILGLFNFILGPLIVGLSGGRRVTTRELAMASFILNFLFLNVSHSLIAGLEILNLVAAFLGAYLMSLYQIFLDRWDEDRRKLII